MWCARNSVITRNSALAGTISILPAGDVCQNRIRILASFGFGAGQFCDNPGDRLMHLGNLLPVIAIVLNYKGRAHPCKYDQEFARQPTKALSPTLPLV